MLQLNVEIEIEIVMKLSFTIGIHDLNGDFLALN